ncbi:MAG: hypothetical protein R2731_18550 [Nocardioides sp.]
MSSIRTPRRWRVTFATTAAVTALTTVLTMAPAHAAVPPDQSAADWLAGQLTAGLVHNDQYGFDDVGLTLDVALALDQIGGHDTTLAEIDTAVQPKVAGYTTGVDWGSDDIYAGATAKAVVFAHAVGADPASYGGSDLLAQLRGRVATADPIRGRLEDGAATDYANVIGQAYAVRALDPAGGRKARLTLRYLLKQQCAGGYFRLSFTKAKRAADQTCDGGNPRKVSTPDTDATALALLALLSVRDPNVRVDAAVQDAARWLRQTQGRSGGFGGGPSTEKANTNSTGLAGWALAEAGSCKRAAKAAGWVVRFQVGAPEAGTLLATEVGAVAYNRAAWRAGKADGITVETRDQWRRATAQAAPVLGDLPVAACRAR